MLINLKFMLIKSYKKTIMNCGNYREIFVEKNTIPSHIKIKTQ